MKKKGILLSVLLMVCMLMSPLGVHAATGTIFAATDSSMEHTTMDGEQTLIYTAGQRPVIYLGVNLTSVDGAPFTEYVADLKLANSNFTFSGDESDVRLNGWEGTITNVGDGVVHIDLKYSREGGLTTTGKNVRVATITLTVNEGTSDKDTCLMTLTRSTDPTTPENPDTPKCKTDTDKEGNTKYYCENCAECTKEEYDAKCTTSTENPKTGSFMPYAVIIAGVAVAGGLYFLTKKNKIYHM